MLLVNSTTYRVAPVAVGTTEHNEAAPGPAVPQKSRKIGRPTSLARCGDARFGLGGQGREQAGFTAAFYAMAWRLSHADAAVVGKCCSSAFIPRPM
jgi:hypothetical protein